MLYASDGFYLSDGFLSVKSQHIPTIYIYMNDGLKYVSFCQFTRACTRVHN